MTHSPSLVELIVEAEGFEQLLHETAAAIGTLLASAEHGDDDRLPMLVLASEPRELVEGFVRDLILLADTEDFAVRRLERVDVRPNSLRCAVTGITGPAKSRRHRLVAESVDLKNDAHGYRLRFRLEVSPDRRREPRAAHRNRGDLDRVRAVRGGSVTK